MKIEIVNVTPKMASEWLAFNTNNRPLRRKRVEGLKRAFLNGEYIQSHQGIAFSSKRVLLDGQHRLTAISELPDDGRCFALVVATEVPETAYMVLDIGAVRTPAEALRMDDRKLVEVARLIAQICTPDKIKPTPQSLLPIIEAIDEPHTALMAFCSTSAKTWSSAPVRLACVMLILNGANSDYVRLLYRAMVIGDFDSMPKVVQALYRAGHEGRVSARDQADIMARCMAAFNVRKASNVKVQIKDASEAMTEVRRRFGYLLKDGSSNKKGATPAAPKGVSRTHSIALAA